MNSTEKAEPPDSDVSPDSRRSDASGAVEAVWRIESGKVIATLARMVGDVSLAEDLAQDALVAALEQWPQSGIPRNGGAWLTATAKRRAIDGWRRNERLWSKYAELAHQLETEPDGVPDPDEVTIDDDLLRLVFIACHPVLSRDARVGLTLRMLGGLTTEEIARAFLATTPTIAQRITRAKRTLSAARVPFELPEKAEIPARLDSVLEVIYLVFNEGYAATSGDDWMRPELCSEAMRLGRVLAGLMPDQSEVHGLVSLMELQASRTAARIDRRGEPVLLLEQDRSRWDQLLIRHGLAALRQAEGCTGPLGSYSLQASIASCHAVARTPEQTDWVRIAALYDALVQLTRSPVVELNRAVAVGMAYGPARGLGIVDSLKAAGLLSGYHLMPAVRGELLARLGRDDEARAEFRDAASLTQNEREKSVLQRRAGD